MLYTDQEAIDKYERILELVETYSLTINNACIRVGMNPTSFISLKRRVIKIQENNGTDTAENS